MTTSLFLQLYPLPQDLSWMSLIICLTFPGEILPHIQQAPKNSKNEATIISPKSAFFPGFYIVNGTPQGT